MTSCAHASAAAPGDALASLVANELAFAAASRQVGPRDAFLRYIADDGIMFLPEPTRAKPWWEAEPPASYALAWYPTHA
ncbi:MAG TPA: hypothetical protein VEW03_13575, partial [Longimicrobiaceae bacterium]|nr:hypothetical protein [Longimicrobiaceae bacterium]